MKKNWRIINYTMKALLIATGRGIGGDAKVTMNTADALEDAGFECEFALDKTAPGLLFKKYNRTWHKISIPVAGGHAASKINMFKAALRTVTALPKAVRLIRETQPDVVVGIIGGGAVIGCLSAKIAGVPAVGLLITPMDGKVCTKLNFNIPLPESTLYMKDDLYANQESCFYPVDPSVVDGNKEVALSKLPNEYDPNKKSVLFSSGSSLFEKTVQGAVALSEAKGDELNILVTGAPLEERYNELLDNGKIINLGFIDWISDLYNLVDLVVLTDDGNMVLEATACKVPIIAIRGVKYGKSHNMGKIFPGAVIESELEDLIPTFEDVFSHLDEISSNANKFGDEILSTPAKIASIIKREAKK